MKATLPQHIKLDERHHVEKPLLDQLAGLGWEVIDLTDKKQMPAATHRESFTEVVMPPVLRERLKVINPWLEDDQVQEGVKQLTASFPSTGLLENNSTCSSSCWRTPASARTVRAARRARPSASRTLRPATTTASSRFASSRSASSAPSTTSSPTSCCSSTACQWW